MQITREELWKSIDDLKLAFNSTMYAIGRAIGDKIEAQEQHQSIYFEKRQDCYYDTQTGLEWALETVGPFDWQEAMVFCEKYGWRLPTIQELLTLVDYNRYNPATALLNVVSSRYWSSTTDADHTNDAWYVNFYNGNDCWSYKSRDYFVRAVRGEPLKYKI